MRSRRWTPRPYIGYALKLIQTIGCERGVFWPVFLCFFTFANLTQNAFWLFYCVFLCQGLSSDLFVCVAYETCSVNFCFVSELQLVGNFDAADRIATPLIELPKNRQKGGPSNAATPMLRAKNRIRSRDQHPQADARQTDCQNT
jgi:hypothetical protein